VTKKYAQLLQKEFDFWKNFEYNKYIIEKRENMTQEQLAKKYGYSEVSIYKNFPAVQAGIYKKTGVIIEKIGKGKKAEYIEKVNKSEEEQMQDLREFLETHPAIKEYFEGIEG
jgi:hypothetical protein